MAQLADAAAEYGNTQSKMLPPGATFDASPGILIAARMLRSDFAFRYGAAATAPLGQAYHAAGVKDAVTGAIQILVWVDGAPRSDQTAYVNLPAGDSGNVQYAKAVTSAIRLKQQRQSASIAANTTIAADTTSSFSIDVTAWVGTPPTITTPSLLKNFMVLGSAPPSLVTQMDASTCSVLMPTSAAATCPVGQHSVAKWPVCGSLNPYVTMPYPVFGTAAGIVTVGTKLRQMYFQGLQCYFGPLDPKCGGVGNPTDYHYDGVVMINNATFHTDPDCGGTVWQYPCAAGGIAMCAVTISNVTVVTYKANAIENLCCPG